MAIIFFVMGFYTLSFAQQIRFRVVSWNVENLFDIHHDSLKNDREFLPDALRHWNYTRYKKKLTDMARVITAVGEWEPPALVGLCEVENDTVLRPHPPFSFKGIELPLCHDRLSRFKRH